MNRTLLRTPVRLIFSIAAALITLLSFVSARPAEGSDVFFLNDLSKQYDIWKRMEVLEDKSGGLTLEDVSGPEFSGQWGPDKEGRSFFGYLDHPLWVRFKLLDLSAETTSWYLELPFPKMERIQLYTPDGQDGFAMVESGCLLPFDAREIKNSNFVFKLPPNALNGQWIYLRLQTRDGMKLALNVTSQAEFMTRNAHRQAARGFFYGLLAALLFFNLFIFLALRDKNFLYFVLYILFFTLHQLFFNGLVFEFLSPETVWWDIHYNNSLASMMLLTNMVFSISFLKMKQEAHRLYQGFLLLSGASLVLTATSPITSVEFSDAYANALGILAILSSMVAGVIRLYQGYRPARYYLLAHFFAFIGFLIFCLSNLWIIRQNVITDNAYKIGLVAQAILFSLALADRYNTLKKENERAQRLAIENLSKADRIKDEFLANTSHELKTPLNGIIGLAESIFEGALGPVSDPVKKSLEMIAGSGRRLAYLVNDILDYSKIKNQGLRLNPGRVDLRQALEAALELSQPLLAGRKITLENRVARDLPPVLADENRLMQILHNLIGNAVKFTPSGKVWIYAEPRHSHENTNESGKSREYVKISISDTGVGIQPENLERIFNYFEQVDASETRLAQGTGLGLAITKKLVELHGGWIDVESEYGAGSCFSFTLPAAADEDEERTIPVAAPAALAFQELIDPPAPEDLTGHDRRRPLILLVDDEPVNLQVLVNYLAMNGFSFVKSYNGSEALMALEEYPDIDLLLLDIMMPGMSGFEVCSKVRETYGMEDLPIIFLTAKNQDYDLLRGFEAGANDYITKPVKQSELLARIRLHLVLAKANEDQVTGIANRKYFNTFYDIEWKSSQREGRPVSVIMIDIDHFKRYNDAYGHQTGDDCLWRTAQTIKGCLNRASDLAARYGGEEFIVLLPNTDENGAEEVAERIRAAVRNMTIPHQDSPTSPYVTVSLGVACIRPGPGQDPETLIKEADHRLYQAKRSGRNRVVGRKRR